MSAFVKLSLDGTVIFDQFPRHTESFSLESTFIHGSRVMVVIWLPRRPRPSQEYSGVRTRRLRRNDTSVRVYLERMISG